MSDQIKFSRSKEDNVHYRNIRRLITNAQTEFPKRRLLLKKIMIISLLFLYLGIYILALNFVSNTIIFYSLYGTLGILSVLIFLNVIHEAAHDKIFKSKLLNQGFLYVFDLIGGNSYIWKKRHILLHHNYQNISGWDSDIEQAGPINIYPHAERSKINAYQHRLIFLLYPLFLFNWIFLRDFKDFFLRNRIIKKVCKIEPIEYIKLFAFKIWFVFYTIIIPIMLGGEPIIIVSGLSILLLIGGTFAMLILLTPHANETNEFPLPNASGDMTISWLEHQFVTTNDITLNNPILSFLMGHFNYHLVHHLFPRVDSAYAPEVTTLIRNYALSNDLNYRTYKLKDALSAHYRLIKSNALGLAFFEEDM